MSEKQNGIHTPEVPHYISFLNVGTNVRVERRYVDFSSQQKLLQNLGRLVVF